MSESVAATRAVTTRAASRGRRVLMALLVVAALALGAAFALSERLAENVTRVPAAFAGLTDAARPPADPTATTFLLVGTDTRADAPTTGSDAALDAPAGSPRSDAILVARIAADGSSAAVVSIPRDSWVDIPGRGRNKINAAYAFGGASLLIQTVEQLSGFRIDHFGVIDFAGFESMVDAVGGIDVRVARATSSRGVDFVEGLNHLDGRQALIYVRQRYDLPGGDLDRAKRQQNALRAVLVKAQRSLGNPVGLLALLDATSRTVSIDDTLSNGGLRDLALRLHGLSLEAVSFTNAPVAGLGREGAQSVVYLDVPRAQRLWAAVRDDTVPQYLALNRADALSRTPN